MARALAADPGVMLMDEPFGAVDPINRERLQNEFLRLQAEVRKTILFVTHDIDEAIKMGDRVAILREGGILAQYATPAELLMAPADDFVEDFVGRRPGAEAPRVAAGRLTSTYGRRHSPTSGRRPPRCGRSSTGPRCRTPCSSTPSGGRWAGSRSPISVRSLSLPLLTSRPDPVIDRDDIMRDALSDVLQHETMYAPVVDAERRIAGVLSVEIISEFLGSKEALAEEHDAVERAAE